MPTSATRAFVLLAAVALAACGEPPSSQPEAGAGVTDVPAAPTSEPEAPSDTPPAAEPLRNMIRWATASEVDNFGYDVYRGLAEEGPFERLNAEPIPGAGTTDEPTKYEYADTTIEPDTAYWYYVESISTDGVRERFTPIFMAKPKPAPGADALEADAPSPDEPSNG